MNDINFKLGDRVWIAETKDTYEHFATVIRFRNTGNPRSVGVRYDDYISDILWWHQPTELKVIEHVSDEAVIESEDNP